MNVVVTGCGLVSSLGLDLVNSCAAARAGIVRSATFEPYPVFFPEDGSSSGAVVHTVPLLTEDFEGEARLIRLVQGGLQDLVRQCPDAPWKNRRCSVYLSVPDVDRLASGSELVAEENTRNEMREAAKQRGAGEAGLERARRLLQDGGRLAGWNGDLLLGGIAESGHTGVAELVSRAEEDLQCGALDLAIVGGVDSLIDEDTLSWLEISCRLKTPDLAQGLQPGEACGFLILETAATAAARNALILARVEAVSIGKESEPLFTGQPGTGQALADVIHRAVLASSLGEQPRPWLVHDLNGESYCANEWGLALFRLAFLSSKFGDPIVWFPMVSFGDTGAATGVIQACVAIRAFARKYAPRSAAGLTSASADASRACIALACG
jgi:3-oxoacyl-[acyl-carrier-protein] synthase-1